MKKINSFLLNDDVPYRERLFVLVSVYALATIMIGTVVAAAAGLAGTAVLVFSFGLAYLCLLIFSIQFGRFEFASISFCYLLNFLMLPIMYMFSGGIKGGMEYFFIPGLIETFILLEGAIKVISLIFFSCWYIFIICLEVSGLNLVRNIPEGTEFIISNAIAVFCSVALNLFIVRYQGILLKRQNIKVGEAMDSCRESARTKSRFLANMSHELRTPMNAIIGMAKLMEKVDEGNEVSDELNVIKDTAETLLKLINDILMYSKLESGKAETVNEQFYFDKLINSIILEAQDAAFENGTELEVELSPDMPFIYYGDEIKISRILTTLLMGAVENTENGRVIMALGAERTRDGSKARITGRITDTGEGLSKEDLENIYNGFESYDSKKDSRIKILGLELTVCRGLLEMMNGELHYDSIKDVGSSVTFSFDCFVADQDSLLDTTGRESSRVLAAGYSEWEVRVWCRRLNEFKTVADHALTEEEFASQIKKSDYSHIFIDAAMYDSVKKYLDETTEKEKTYIVGDITHRFGDFRKCRLVRRPLTLINLSDIFCDRWNEKEYENAEDVGNFVCRDTLVVVVDDNRVNLKVAQNLLESYRIRVIPADSGFVAIGILRNVKPDIIFMDQVMPGIGGVETMQEIKYDKRNADIPVICLTADLDDDIKENLIENGFDDYLPKPIRDKQVEKILLDYLPSTKIVYKGMGKTGRLRDEA
ncbi:MAG: response regulator [Lachnospiraceae bacterium]|nr:response regulator [Lachnospiraceae bacterium]